MTEKEPLNSVVDSNKGQIVTANYKNNEDDTIMTNGHKNNVVHTNDVQNILKKLSQNGNKEKAPSNGEHIEAPSGRGVHDNEPPDGGMRAWLVMLSAFICNGVIFGIINCYGNIHSLLTDRLTDQGDKEASSKAALVGSLTIGTTFLLSPVAGCLTDKIGLRLTTFIGGLLCAGGLLLSSFFTQSIGALYLTYGIMFGCGAALAYTPTLAILGHYFKRYLGKVSGFVTAGSSVFTIILPPALDTLLKSNGLESTLRIMSAISCFIIVCSFVYKPLHPPPEPPKLKPGRSRISQLFYSIINVDIWKSKRYVIWALCVPLALFGYFVPYVHMVKFVKSVFPGMSTNLPVMCIGITSGIGRLIFGAIADLPGVNRIYLQQLSLICIGVVTLLLPMTSSYALLIAFTLIMGLFDGCFISLLGPIAYEICGASGATQAIGFLLGLSSLPLTVGPPIAGRIYDSTGSYTVPLILAGIPPIVGASVMFLALFVRNDATNGNGSGNGTSNKDIEANASKPKGSWTDNDSKPDAPLMNGHTNSSNIPSLEVNGRARLADTGIESYASADSASTSASAFNSTNAFHACGFGDPNYPTTSNKCICYKTALLSSHSSMSSLVNADQSLGTCDFRNIDFANGKNNDFVNKRRYKYSVY